jgi:uncharacterized surface protein with fasciclin (FAS1) repeats
MSIKPNPEFFIGYKALILLPLLMILILNSCNDEPKLWLLKSNVQMASEYIKSKPEYSEFAKLVEVTGLESILSLRGPYTVMIPTNDAMFEYYAQKNVSSLMDFDEKFLSSLVRNHIIANEIPSGDIGLGAIRDTNAIGDFLITEFHGTDIILNKFSKIIDRDIRLANGYAHVIDRVIDPVTKDIYTVILEDFRYKIFAEGLKLTGIIDTLKLISFHYGNVIARTRFTVLAVSDSVYHANGIENIDTLIKWCGATPDNLTNINNPFYRYMEYHCLTGTYYLSDLNTRLYPILSHDNNVSMTITDDYKINFNRSTMKYTGFIIPDSNTPSKNGALHAINDMLPVSQPEPTTITFETTDFFDFKLGDYYQNYYMMWFDGENSFQKIHWEGDFMQYYYQAKTSMMNLDCIRMTGYWKLSVTFPKVMKGKYSVIFGELFLSEEANFCCYLDGVLTPYNYKGDVGGEQKIADADFSTTAEHTVTIRSTNYGYIFWDYVKFVPVN